MRVDRANFVTLWSAASGQQGASGFSVGDTLWREIAERVEPGMRTLEFGSGLSTLLFGHSGCDHWAVENNRVWFDLVRQCVPLKNVKVSLNPISEGWYSWEWERGAFDLVLIDGPTGKIGRTGVLNHLDSIADENTIIIVDDYHRPEERKLTEAISRKTGRQAIVFGDKCDGHSKAFAVFERRREMRVVGTGRCGTGFAAKSLGLGHERFTKRGISSCKNRHVFLSPLLFEETVHVVRDPLNCIASLTTISDESWAEFLPTLSQVKPKDHRTSRETLEMAVAHYWHRNRFCERISDKRWRVEDLSERDVVLDDVPENYNGRAHRDVTVVDVLGCPHGADVVEMGLRYGYSIPPR